MGVRRGDGEDRHVHLDLRAFGGVVEGAVADLGGQFAEQSGASQGGEGPADLLRSAVPRPGR